MMLYAISNHRDLERIVCENHLRATLDELPNLDAFILDMTLLRPEDVAVCATCEGE